MVDYGENATTGNGNGKGALRNFSCVQNGGGRKALLEDLCTYTETEQMAQRAKAAQLLKAGKTYTEVIAATNISSATLSRVSRCVRHGSGGYEKFVPQAEKED